MWDETRTWWASVTGGGSYVHAVVLGLRQGGKTTFFRELSQDPADRVRLWKVSPLARARETEVVWADLWRLLGAGAEAADSRREPRMVLAEHLAALDEGPILVIDDWDGAVGGRESEAPIACYEVLDTLARYCVGQDSVRSDRATLGLVLLTSLPDVADLLYFARAASRPTFERLSELITRLFQAERFPLLSRIQAEQVLTGAGVPGEAVGEIADACGGWLWLLREAAGLFSERGRWDFETRARLREHNLLALLDESLFKHLAARPEVRSSGRTPLAYLSAELGDGRDPATFGLPHRFDCGPEPAPLVSELLNRTVLLVDTENLRMPFQKDAERRPGRYPDGVDVYLQATIGSWLAGLIREHSVRDEDVLLVGRNATRIDATVGAGLPGKRWALTAGLREKSRKKMRSGDASDDQLLIAHLTQQAERYPLARLAIVSGDADAPLIFSQVDFVHRLLVIAPWGASARLSGVIPKDNIIAHSLPVSAPPQPRNRAPGPNRRPM